MLALDEPAAPSADRVVGSWIGVFLIAFAITFTVAPLMRWLAIRNGIVDRPDLTRKSQLEPVAYLGGVALFLGWLGGVLCTYVIGPEAGPGWDPALVAGVGFPLSLIFGATVITLTGLIDDVYGISPRVKIGGQFLAAAALAWSAQNLGVKLVNDTLAVGGLSVPFLVAYVLGAVVIAAFVVGGCNSMNLMDGLDGLAAGVSAIVFVGFLFIAVNVTIGMADPSLGRVPVVMCLASLGAVLGFLPYNYNPAHIFMGDAGSLLIGYLCVSTLLLFADAPRGGPVWVAAGLIVYALPITDMFITIWRRALQGQPLLQADTGHLHHRVLYLAQRFIPSPNLCVKLAVWVMYLLAAVFAVVGCSLMFVRWRYVMTTFVAIFGFVLVGAYKTGRRQAILEKGRRQKSRHAISDAAAASVGDSQPAETTSPSSWRQ